MPSKPLFNYVIYRQKRICRYHSVEGLPDIGIEDPTFKMIMERVWNHMSHNHPPAIMTLKPPQRVGPVSYHLLRPYRKP